MIDLDIKRAFINGEWASLNRVLFELAKLPEDIKRDDIYKHIENMKPLGVSQGYKYAY